MASSTYKYLFGPVGSRRLGSSLGVDIIPFKICSFDCLYCECGSTTQLTSQRREFYPPEEILAELKHFLKNFSGKVDYITVTGSGEPTLNLQLEKLAREIKTITPIPLALLTNGSLFHLKDVQKECQAFDVVAPSLDAVSQDAFQKINQPHQDVDLQQLKAGLIEFSRQFEGKLFLEVLLARGINDSQEEMRRLQEFISQLECLQVQINTVTRPPAYRSAYPVSNQSLGRFAELIGPQAKVVVSSYTHQGQSKEMEFGQQLLTTLKRRPCTARELSQVFDIELKVVKHFLDQKSKEGVLSRQKMPCPQTGENKVYFCMRS